jgi:hypothetical protein
VGPGELRLEGQHALRARRRVGNRGEREQPLEVRAVPRPDLGHPRRPVAVEVAVRKPEAALHEVDGVPRRLVQVLLDEDAQRPRRRQVRAVEDVDVCAHRPAELGGERAGVGERCDPCERGAERREPLRLDAGLVHEARVEIADLARVGAGGRVGAGRPLDDRARARLDHVRDAPERAGARPVRRDLGRPHERAIREVVEVIAGLHCEIHRGEVDAAHASGGHRGRRLCRRRGADDDLLARAGAERGDREGQESTQGHGRPRGGRVRSRSL